jgi:hypothetical protein
VAAGPYAPSDALNYVGVGKESSRGTGVAPTMFAPYIGAVDLSHNQNITAIKEAGQAGKVTYSEKVSHIPGGKFPILGRPSTLSKLFAYLMGVDNISGSGPYTHTITDDLVTDYVSIEQTLNPGIVERFVDGYISSITITADVTAPSLRAEVEWMACSPAVQGSGTSTSYETDLPFILTQAAFTLDGSGVTNVRRFVLTIKPVFSAEQLQKPIPEYIQKEGFDVSLELDQFTTDIANEYRLVQYGATGGTAYQTTPSTGAFIADFTYGAGGGAREAKFEIPLLVYTEATYTALDPNASEATKVNRQGYAQVLAGSPLFRYTGKTADSSPYV